MYKGVKYYKGNALAPGSDAAKLLEEKKLKDLDKHLEELEKNFVKLEGRPSKRKGS